MSRVRAWFRKMLGRSERTADAPASFDRSLFPRLYESRLESRRVLNGGPVATTSELLTLAFDAGHAANDGRADRFELSRQAGGDDNRMVLSINDQQVWSGNRHQVQALHLRGSNDADQFVVDPGLALPGIVFIHGHDAPAGQSDSLVFAFDRNLVFDQITYQTRDRLLEVNFVSPALAGQLNSRFQVEGVEQVVDGNQAIERRLRLHSTDQPEPSLPTRGNWSLSTADRLVSDAWQTAATQTQSLSQTWLQLSEDQASLNLALPSTTLTVDTADANGSRQAFRIHDADLSSLKHFNFRGDSSDTLSLESHLQLGNQVDIRSGDILVSAQINAVPSSEMQLAAGRSIELTSAARLISTGSRVTLNAPHLDHRGLMDVGAAGYVRFDSGPSGLTSIGGIVRATSTDATGGTIHLLGRDVRVLNDALIDTSGGTGGGQILIGGDLQGRNAAIANSQYTFIAERAQIFANAIQRGDGGRIIVWSDNQAIIESASAIRARGGAQGGSGGFIETSGKQHLMIRGVADTSAAMGLGGTWLLDPPTIQIVAAIPVPPPPAGVTYLLASDIHLALLLGNFTVQTSAAGTGDGDIIVDAIINPALVTNSTLTLNALRDVIVNQAIQGGSKLGVEIIAGRNVSSSTVTLDQLDFLKITATGDVDLGGVVAGNGDGNAAQAVDISANKITTINALSTTGGAIRLSATYTGVGASLTLDDIDSAGGVIELRSSAEIALNGGAGSISSTGGNGRLIIAGVSTSTTLGIGTGANGTLTINDTSLSAIADTMDAGIEFGLSGQSGNIELAGAAKSFSDALTIRADGGATVNVLTNLDTVQGGATNKSITITGNASTTVNLAANLLTAGGNITLTGGTLLVDGGAGRQIASGGNPISVNNGGNIDLSGLTSIDGTGGPASLTIDSRGTQQAGSIKLANVTAAQSGLNQLNLRSDSTTDGQVELGNIRLVANGVTPSQLNVNTLDATPTAILASGLIDLSSNQLGVSGGSVNFGSAIVAARAANSTLTIHTRNTNTTAGADGSSGGNVTLGGIGSSGGNFFDTLEIDVSAADAADASGQLGFAGLAAPTVAVDGSSGGNANLIGITLTGNVANAAATTLTLQTNPSSTSNFDSRAIDLRKTNFTATGALRMDTSGSGNARVAGNVLVSDIGLTTQPAGITIDTRGSSASGRTILNDGDGNTTPTVMQTSGALDLRNTVLELADNATLRTFGNASLLQVGAVVTDGSARNLTLTSDGQVTTAQTVNLSGGQLQVSIDANQDGVASFQSTGLITAGSFLLSGSAGQDDTATISGGLTTTAGSIQLNNLSRWTLNSAMQASTSVSSANVTTVELGTGAGITTVNGSIDLATTVGGVLLSGNPGSTNALSAQGNSSLVLLAPVTTVGSGVGLDVQSDYSATLSSVTLTAGLLAVTIGRNTTLTDATATLSTVTAGGLQLTGNNRVNDRAILNGVVNLTSLGFQASALNQLDVNANVTSGGSGGISMNGNASTTVNLAANLLTAGGNITLTGGTLLVNGGAGRQIASGGNPISVNNGGNIDLSGLTSIDGTGGPASLTIDSRGTQQAGSIKLANVTAAQSGLNQLNLRSDSTTDGQVELGNIRLVANGVTPSQLNVNTLDATPTAILASGLIDLSSNQLGVSGGSVNFGSAIVAARTANSTLTIHTRNTNTTAGADGSSGGNVTLGGIGSSGGNFFDTLEIDVSAADAADASGQLDFAGLAAPTVAVDGSSGGNANLIGITLTGNVVNAAATTLTLQTNPANTSNFDSRAIDLRKTNFTATGALRMDTSGSGNARAAGNVLVSDIGLTTQPAGITIDTRGSSANGRTILNDGDGNTTPTIMQTSGSLDLRNTVLELADNATLRTFGNASLLQVGAVVTDGSARNLTLTSDGQVTTAQTVNLSGGQLQVSIDANQDGVASFQSTGLITAGSFLLSGSAGQDDTATISGGLTTTAGSIQLNNLSRWTLNSAMQASTSVSSANVTTVELGTGAGITTVNGSIDLATTVGGVSLSGNPGSTNVLSAQGNSSLVLLAPVTTVGSGVGLDVQSDYSATLSSVTLTAGLLAVTIGRNTTLTDATATLSTVTAGGLQLTGNNRVNDRAILNGVVNLTSLGFQASALNQLDVNANVTSGGNLTITNVADRVQIAQSVNLNSTGIMNMQSGVRQIELAGASGSTNRFESSSDAGALSLARTISLGGVDLQLVSAGSMSLQPIEIGTLGNLNISIDSNNNSVGSSLSGSTLQAGSIRMEGGPTVDDTANFSGSITATRTTLTFQRFHTLQWSGDVAAVTQLLASDIASRITVQPGVAITTSNGNVQLQTSVNEILFVSGAAITNTVRATSGEVQMAAIRSQNAGGQLNLIADGDVQLTSSNWTGLLSVTAGSAGPVGKIVSTGRLTASALALDAATGIGGVSDLQTASTSISAVNRGLGDIRLANQTATTTTVQNLSAGAGGNVSFRQTGGGAARFQAVQTVADGTPINTENTITLAVTGGTLIVEGSGLITNGIGLVSLSTLATGDIQLAANVQAGSTTAAFQSAGKITGSGTLLAQSATLTAVSDIGGATAFNTQAKFLAAQVSLGRINLDNTSASAVQVNNLSTSVGGSINLLQRGGGDLTLVNASAGASSAVGRPDLTINNSSGALQVTNNVLVGGQGNLQLVATGDIVLAPASRLITSGTTATIDMTSGGRVQMQPGAVVLVGISNPLTQAVLTRIPPVIVVTPLQSSPGINVDALGVVTIEILLPLSGLGATDENFSLTIDWGGGDFDRFPFQRSPNTADPGITRFDASLTPYRITHQYLQNPNVNDAAAPIPIQIDLAVDSQGRIRITDSLGSTQNLSKTVLTNLEVTASGLFSLFFVLPQAPTVQPQLVFNRDVTATPPVALLPPDQTIQLQNYSASTTVSKTQKYVLRIVTPVNDKGDVKVSEDIEIDAKEVGNFQSLFQRLGDNHYRIYSILENGNEILVKDFLLRNHIPIEIEEGPLDTETPMTDERTLEPTPSGNESVPDGSLRKAARRFRSLLNRSS